MRKSSLNKSLSSSRTKTIISKNQKPKEEQKKQNLSSPYFQPDPIRDGIAKRVKNQKQNIQRKTPPPRDIDHLGKAGQIIKDLFRRHEDAKQKLKKMKQESEKKYNEIYSFTPNKNKSERYMVEGDVVRRNEIWLREKNRRQMQLKQEQTLKNLQQCTFSPTFSTSKKLTQQYIKQREASTSQTPKKPNSRYNTLKSTSPFKSSGKKKDFTQSQYEQAKRNIISKMMGSLRD